MKKVRIGVMGAYRGSSMINYCEYADNAKIVAICFLADNLWVRYAFGTLVFLLSAYFSFRLLNKESNLVARLVNKFITIIVTVADGFPIPYDRKC